MDQDSLPGSHLIGEGQDHSPEPLDDYVIGMIIALKIEECCYQGLPLDVNRLVTPYRIPFH